MNWTSHMAIGALCGALLALFIGASLTESLLLIPMASVSALAPDIDHDSSKIRKTANMAVPIGAFAFSIAVSCTGLFPCVLSNIGSIAILGLAITGLYAIIITFAKPKHRGITHTIFSALIFGLFIWLVSDIRLALAGFAGYSSHLFADMHIKII